MNQLPRSTMVAIGVFVAAGALYVFVGPQDIPAPESPPIPVFVVTTPMTETTLPDGIVPPEPTTETTLPPVDAPTDESEPTDEVSDPDPTATTTEATTTVATTTVATTETTAR